MRLISLRCLTFIVIMCVESFAYAKCPFQPYQITGAVFDETSKKPVPQATIMVFLDNQTKIWSDGGYAKKYPDFVITKSNGVFVASSSFLTLSGDSPQGDECNKIPKKLEVIILAPGYLAHREIIDFSTVKENQGKEAVEVALKPIYIERPRNG